MSASYLTIDELATFLRLTPAKAQKLLERDKIPARRVGGQWRVEREELHHWLEERLGLSDEDEELTEVERMVDVEVGPQTRPLVDFFPEGAIHPVLSSRSRGGVIRETCDLAGQTGLLWDIPAMQEAVAAREELHPTALDNGVALLHPRRPKANILAETFLVLGRLPGGVPFGGGALTDLFFLIQAQDDRTHLHLLARLSRMIQQDHYLADLREAEDAAGMRAVIARFDEESASE